MKKGLDDKRGLGRLQRMTYGRSVGPSLVHTRNLIIRVGCALVCRISGSGIRRAVLRSVWKMIKDRTVARSHIIAWRKHLESRNLSDASIRRKLSALSGAKEMILPSSLLELQ
jgi:hypothetical protein